MEEDEIPLPRPRTPHIKKRALKNKALTVSFKEELRDYVTGFHKRKKKRRREAEQQQEEALRHKRIELRKKLLPSDNLILQEMNRGVVWQSFDYLADSFWPQMKLGSNTRTCENKFLTTWLGLSDPSYGNFTAGIVDLYVPDVEQWRAILAQWSMEWTGLHWSVWHGDFIPRRLKQMDQLT